MKRYHRVDIHALNLKWKRILKIRPKGNVAHAVILMMINLRKAQNPEVALGHGLTMMNLKQLHAPMDVAVLELNLKMMKIPLRPAVQEDRTLTRRKVAAASVIV